MKIIKSLIINKEKYGHLPLQDVKEALGLLPMWVHEFNVLDDDDDIINFMRHKYEWGLSAFNGTVTDTGAYKSEHDEDEDLDYIAKMKTKQGTVYFYPYAIIALPTRLGKYHGHFITRMD